MPPIFEQEFFKFKGGEEVPEHIEDYPRYHFHEHNPKKWWLYGMDSFDYTEYVLAINIDDADTAYFLARARQRLLNETQPNAGSLQDKVNIMGPHTSPQSLRL